MSEVARVLIVEDVPTDAMLVQREVRHVLPGCEFHVVETRDDYVAALASFRPDIILSDYGLPYFDGMSALELATEMVPDTPIVIVTGSMSEDTAVACMKGGAWDYVLKEHVKRLGPAIMVVLEQQRLRSLRKQAETALRESVELYRLLADNASDVIWVWDAESDAFRYVSPSVERMRGYTAEEVMGQSLLQSLTVDSRRSVESVLEDRIERCRQGHTEYYADEIAQYHKDGHTVATEVTSRYVLNPTSGRVEAIGVARDIGERKQAQQQIEEQLDELRRWQDVMLGREDRVQELKREVNALCIRLGEAVRYLSQEPDIEEARLEERWR